MTELPPYGRPSNRVTSSDSADGLSAGNFPRVLEPARKPKAAASGCSLLKRGNRYETLDGLRGVGALWVMLLHFAPELGIATPAHGYLAVDLFFCLSGFVLTRSYALKIEGGMGFGEWIAVRLIRLYPLYFFSLTLGVLAALFARVPGSQLDLASRVAAIATGLMMLPSPTWNSMPEMFPFNFVAWSLFIEMLLSALFFWSCRWSTRAVWLLMAIGLGGLAAVRIFDGYIGGGFAWRDAPAGLARGIFAFSAGMLIARQPSTTRIASNFAWLPLIVIGVVMSVRPPHGVAYDLVAVVLAIPSITYWAVRIEPRNATLFRLFGDLSYPIYAVHSVSFFMLTTLGRLSPSRPLPLIAGGATICAFLGICWLLDQYFDRPIRDYFARLLRQRALRLAAP